MSTRRLPLPEARSLVPVVPPDTTKIDSLARILQQEEEGGYRDSTVIGGLDRFLLRWDSELKPVLGDITSYSILTPPQREFWAKEANDKIASSDGPVKTRRSKAAAPARPPRRQAARKAAPFLSLSDSVVKLKGISRQNVPKLKKLGAETVGDLVYDFPHRHNDFADIRSVSDLKLGEDQTVVVTVWEATETRSGARRSSTQAVLGDETGNVRAIWFNQGYLARTFRPGTRLVLSGKANVFRGSFVFESPEYELLQDQEDLVHTGRLVPVYPTVDGFPQRTLRRLVKQALDAGISQIMEVLPEEVRHRVGLTGLQNAISQAHYPDTVADWTAARRRLAFDELLLLQLVVLSRKRHWQQENDGIALKVDEAALDGFLGSLPFELTKAQSKVLEEILSDIVEATPMSRLLQGDVGSGKTVVAAAALVIAALNGHQAALIAPTEILAEQHFLTLRRLLSGKPETDANHVALVGDGVLPRTIKVGLLLGSQTKKIKAEMHERISAGEIDVLIGTHALIQEGVEPPSLALAVVDEQHRFGVMQRASIRGKGRKPHLLAMSATPIPRSLALTVYGDLDVSVIDEIPPGRQPIKTRWLAPDKRDVAYEFVRKQVAEGRQAFIVCPLIEKSEALQTRSAVEEHQLLSTKVFPELNLELLHGRMKLREKESKMERFQAGDVNILVSTPVIEVGIDVPNATVMLVDGADRFGLAQLHQFRGRVGRGEHQSFCLLLADSPGEEARERLKLAERIDDGFELAEEDLRIRGPGDYMGTRQSGLPQLKVARITDHDILALARREATRMLDADPDLKRDEHRLLGDAVKRIADSLTDEMS